MSVAYSLVTGTAFAATAGAKTLLMAIAPAGHGLALVEFAVSTDGVTSSAVPAVLEVVQSTQAGAGTSGVSPTITQTRGRASSGSAPTGGSNYTAEPTALTVVRRYFVSQFMGTFVIQLPLGRELETDSSAGTVKAIGLRVNVSANVNVIGSMEVEAAG